MSTDTPDSESESDEDFDPNDVGFDPVSDDRLDHLPESVRQRAPDDEDAIAWEEDFLVQRDPETEEVLPIWQPIPGEEKRVCVYPMTNGQAEQWLPESNPLELDDAQKVALLREFYVQPDIAGAGIKTVEDLEESALAFGVDPLLGALLNASGMDAARSMFMANSQLQELIQGNSNPGS